MENPAQMAPDAPLKNAILIAGPTASGKSALALELARRTGGVIVNADSMQVYGVLRVLTARPDDAQLRAAPHLLYGHVDPREAHSTGRWLRELAALRLEGRRPILVGGTGLYLSAITQGLSEIPAVPAPVRAHWRGRLEMEGASALHPILAARDAVAGAAIRASDGQRIVRALEVLEATGRPISDWHASNGAPLVDRDSARRFVIEPDRRELGGRISRRFNAMVEEGAIEEVRALTELDLDPALPAAKAIGVRELAAAIRGETTLAEAVERAGTATRQYAKRQSTWFRNRLGTDWQRLAMGEMPRLD